MKKHAFFRLNKTIDKELFERFELFLEKIKEKPEIENVYLMFDTKGGELNYAFKIIELINESKLKFFGIAYKEVHSSAIPIFLLTHVRFGYEKASALIHRAKVKKGPDFSSEADLKIAEKQVFEIIANKLFILAKDVENLADANNGEGTFITMSHSLGNKFFIGS